MNQPPQNTSPHPSTTVLLAYHAEDLSPQEADVVREHLVECDACLQAVLDMARFEEELVSEDVAEGGAPEEKWAEFQNLLGASGSEVSEPEPIPLPPTEIAAAAPPPQRAQSQPFLPLAALCLLCLGLTGLTISQRNALKGHRSPAPTDIVYLTGDDSSATRGASPTSVPLTSDAAGTLVVLTSNATTTYSSYRLEALPESAETPLWTVENLRPLPGGLFQIFLPRQSMPPGTYRLRLYGLEDDDEHPLDLFHLHLEFVN